MVGLRIQLLLIDGRHVSGHLSFTILFFPVFYGRAGQNNHTRWITVAGTTPKAQGPGRIPPDRLWARELVHGGGEDEPAHSPTRPT